MMRSRNNDSGACCWWPWSAVVDSNTDNSDNVGNNTEDDDDEDVATLQSIPDDDLLYPCQSLFCTTSCPHSVILSLSSSASADLNVIFPAETADSCSHRSFLHISSTSSGSSQMCKITWLMSLQSLCWPSSPGCFITPSTVSLSVSSSSITVKVNHLLELLLYLYFCL